METATPRQSQGTCSPTLPEFFLDSQFQQLTRAPGLPAPCTVIELRNHVQCKDLERGLRGRPFGGEQIPMSRHHMFGLATTAEQIGFLSGRTDRGYSGARLQSVRPRIPIFTGVRRDSRATVSSLPTSSPPASMAVPPMTQIGPTPSFAACVSASPLKPPMPPVTDSATVHLAPLSSLDTPKSSHSTLMSLASSTLPSTPLGYGGFSVRMVASGMISAQMSTDSIPTPRLPPHVHTQPLPPIAAAKNMKFTRHTADLFAQAAPRRRLLHCSISLSPLHPRLSAA